VAEFGWAIVIGMAAPIIGRGIFWLAQSVKPQADRRLLVVVPAVGLVVGLLAFAFALATGKPTADVLFSGQNQLGRLITHAASYTVGALVLLLLFKALAYGVSLGGFRGGPTFPAMFVGATGGIALSHLPGLPLVPAVAMGIGAMTAAVLTLPLSSVLLATLLLRSDGLNVMPLVIVAVTVAYVGQARLAPRPAAEPEAAPARTIVRQ